MKGLLLVNLGTPDAPTPEAVRKYLAEFLSDPFVIDLHPAARWLLLNAVILPFRPKKSAAAYQKIWQPQGSPLLTHSLALVGEVARALEGDYVVQLAMRYGKPSLGSALLELKGKGVTDLTVFPLYPQYASSSTESTVVQARKLAPKEMKLRFVPEFYDDAGFLDAFARVARPVLEGFKADHLLFSFHGLPVRHILKEDKTGQHCLQSPACCDAISDANRHCYRAQSFYTARALAHRLGLKPDQFSVGFQSRLTSNWIQPFSDVLLVELAQKKVKRLAVMCPAFVADCLETLEEIGLRARESFLQAGGEDLVLVPSLNSSLDWAQTVARLGRDASRS